MNEKYCRPIIKQTMRTVTDEIDRTHNQYGYFEIWLDYLDDMDDEFVSNLAKQYPDKIIVHFRRLQSEPIRTPLDKRLHALHALNGLPAFVDLDITMQKAEYTAIDSENVELQIIGSYHNYQETPSNADLSKIVAEISIHQPAIIKVSTFCNADTDALRLLALGLQLKAQQRKHIILGMGQQGSATRIFGTIWGNELVFAPEESDEQSAPGQFTRRQLDVIFQNLNL